MILSFVSIIPLFINLAVIVFIIWGIVSIVSAQGERNKILKEISAKLDKIDNIKKED
ncbi:hypothetical protein [Cytobacillus gottheilii]|uniref:Uncharacterized protein n=1 Tax=Cytobacillus gottheilii TaxID=859144 RepID=A0ABX8FA50_9BACI|nr:hypothetical protein [Cytobacillus gottheilii]QVY60437.1 hypothetical protein J1899_15645 [Cytobacillus gottheilii]